MFTVSAGEQLCDGQTPVNYSLVAGDQINNSVTFNQSVGGDPINLTGYTAKMSIAFPNNLVELTTGNGGISIPTPANGEAFIIASSTQTNAWPIGTYNYDFWLISTLSPPSENQYFSGLTQEML